MYAYLANALHFQPERQAFAPTVFDWFKQTLQAYEAHQLERQHIAHLRTFDRHILRDMGVDMTSLGKMRPKLAPSGPHAIATNALGHGSLPTHVGSR